MQPAEAAVTACGAEVSASETAKSEFPKPVGIDQAVQSVSGDKSARQGKHTVSAVGKRSMAGVAGKIDWPASAEMRIVLSAPIWKTAIRHARLAATSEEGRSKRSRIGEEQMGCVRIVAEDGEITFESSVSKFAARHVVISDGTDATIVADGVACVPVKDLQTIVGKPSANCAITIAFCPTIPNEPVPVDMKDKLSVGEVEIGIVTANGAVSKSRCDTFSPAGFLDQVFPAVSDLDVVFTGKATCMRRPYADVSFSTNPDDPNKVFNKLAVFTKQEEVIFLGANGYRCALYRSKADKFDAYVSIDEQLSLLIDIEYLTPVLSSLSGNDPITLAVAQDRGHIYILSGRTTYCIAMAGEQSRKNYPTVCKVIEMKTGATALIDRKGLLLAATSLYAVRNDSGQYIFAADGKLHLHAQCTMAIKAADAVVPYTWASDVKLTRTDIRKNSPRAFSKTIQLGEGSSGGREDVHGGGARTECFR